jgi:hypothetical protein
MRSNSSACTFQNYSTERARPRRPSTQTTNLGVRSSNLFGRAKSSTKIETSLYYRNPPCRMGKSAWHLHGKERGLLVSTRASDAGRLCDYASGCLLQRNCLQRRRWHPISALACCRVCKPGIDGPCCGKFGAHSHCASCSQIYAVQQSMIGLPAQERLLLD